IQNLKFRFRGGSQARLRERQLLISRHCLIHRIRFEITGTMSVSVMQTKTMVHDFRLEMMW
ncbi:MAG: hypothetical protein P8X68_11840, partial [Desulfobacterales bacterium]